MRLLILCLIAMLSAAPIAAQQQRVELGPLIAAGDFDGARAALTTAGGNDIDRAFLEGVILRAQGQNEAAIQLYRAVLRIRPDLLAFRQALAETLYLTGQFEAAEFQLSELESIDPNAANRRGYRNFRNRILAEKPYGFGGSVAIVPSSNINRGTANTTFSTGFGDFTIDDTGRETTGTGLSLSGSAFRRFSFPDGSRITLSGQVSGILYEDDTYTQYTLGAVAAYERPSAYGLWALSLKRARTFFGDNPNVDETALGVGLTRTINPRTQVTYSANLSQLDYITDNFLDGPRYRAGVSLRHRLSANTQIGGSLTLERGDAEAERFQFDAVTIGGDITRLFANGVQLTLGLEIQAKPYRGDFSGVDFPRDDTTRTIRFEVFNSQIEWNGAAPSLSCRYSDTSSNIAFYDYDVTECTIGLTRRF